MMPTRMAKRFSSKVLPPNALFAPRIDIYPLNYVEIRFISNSFKWRILSSVLTSVFK